MAGHTANVARRGVDDLPSEVEKEGKAGKWTLRENIWKWHDSFEQKHGRLKIDDVLKTPPSPLL